MNYGCVTVCERRCGSYGGDGLQETEVDADEPVEVVVGKPQALHVEPRLRCLSEVRHLLGQDLTAQHQRVVVHKVLVEEILCGFGNRTDARSLGRLVPKKTAWGGHSSLTPSGVLLRAI